MHSFLFLLFVVCYPLFALAVIEIKHHKFWDTKTNQEFVIKGMAYQPRENDVIIDPITDQRESIWRKDLEIMAELGLNVVRVYEVDASVSHDKFMAALKEKNMYLLLDLGQGKNSINREFPSYNLDLLNRYKRTMDAFAEHDHTFAFIAGNEVMNAVNTTESAPYMKALIRDLKLYAKTKPRPIPIGYASNDDAQIRLQIRDYLTCTTDRLDFLAINVYSWCGNSTFEQSGFNERMQEYAQADFPVMIGETGCNLIRPRTFGEIKSIYTKMRSVFAGAVFYELTEETNQYGLIEYRQGRIYKLPDFDYFKKEIAIQVVPETDIQPKPLYQPACPAQSEEWMAVEQLPPTPNDCVCQAMKSSLYCMSVLSTQSSLISKNLGSVCGLLAAYEGENACQQISQGRGSLGNWGQYATCSFADQLSFAYNQYYLHAGKSDCDFKGTGRRVNPQRVSPSSCQPNTPKIESSASTLHCYFGLVLAICLMFL